MSYQYSMLRFVPDPARGEYVNFGLVAGDSDEGDWELRLLQNLRRARAIDNKGALSIALAFAARLEDHIAAADQFDTDVVPITAELLLRFSQEMQNVVQVTPPAPVVADSAEAALDLLYPELVVDPASPTYRFEKKHRAVARTRRAYKDHDVPDNAITERAPVTAGAYEGVFDFGVSNGEVVQLVQCWSFQLPNQEELAEQVKAWAWVVRGLREHGGMLRVGESEVVGIPSGESLDVVAVFAPPAEDQEAAPAFAEARAAFDELAVSAFTRDEADAVGARAAERLGLAVGEPS